MARRSSKLLGLAVPLMAFMAISSCFVPAPRAPPTFNPTVAAAAAMPVLTLLADDAEAKYGDSARWSAILVPLTTLIVPGITFAAFTLYVFQEDTFIQDYRIGNKEFTAKDALWRAHPGFATIKDPLGGLVSRDDWEKGLEEAWEKAKPAGSSVTVKDKLKELGTQNAPHYYLNKHEEAVRKLSA